MIVSVTHTVITLIKVFYYYTHKDSIMWIYFPTEFKHVNISLKYNYVQVNSLKERFIWSLRGQKMGIKIGQYKRQIQFLVQNCNTIPNKSQKLRSMSSTAR